MVIIYHCKRCNYEWATRKHDGKPQTCPKCRSHVWEKDKTAKDNMCSRDRQVPEWGWCSNVSQDTRVGVQYGKNYLAYKNDIGK